VVESRGTLFLQTKTRRDFVLHDCPKAEELLVVLLDVISSRALLARPVALQRAWELSASRQFGSGSKARLWPAAGALRLFRSPRYLNWPRSTLT